MGDDWSVDSRSGGSPSRLPRPTAAWLRLYRIAGRVTQPTFTLGNLVVLRRRGSEVLLVRQRFRTPSRWGLPGGFQKSHETAADGARRELREEVGLDLPVRAEDQVAQYQQPWARHIDTVFVVDIGDLGDRDDGDDGDDKALRPRRTSLEILAVGWFAADSLPALTREASLAFDRLGRAGRS